MTKSKQNILSMCVCAVFAALICVVSPFAVPTQVPITLATLAVYICAGCLPPAMSAISVTVYLVIGAVGVPVFAGFTSGAAKLIGPTGGYLVGYIPMAVIVSVITSMYMKKCSSSGRAFGRGAAQAGVRLGAMILGTAVLYALGTAWFVIQQKTTVAAALPLCVFPFLPGDAAKMVAATAISQALSPVIRRTLRK